MPRPPRRQKPYSLSACWSNFKRDLAYWWWYVRHYTRPPRIKTYIPLKTWDELSKKERE